MMDGMDDLVQWLRAQLDDEERVALDAGGRHWGREAISCVVDATDNRLIVYGEGTPSSEQADHIARHDPARVLREVEAKRRILARHAPMSGGACDRCWGNDDKATWPCADVRDVASAYSDRPGYREEWRP